MHCRQETTLIKPASMFLIVAAIFPFAASAQSQSPSKPNPAIASEENILKADPLPMTDVRLLGGPLKHAQDLDAKYLLELEPDRMLAYLRERAKLQPKAKPYGGWDGAGRQLTGHIAGHYLSAVSLMYAATGDARFKERADYIVAQLKEVQDAQGDGYIGALMDGQGVDGKIRFQELSKGNIRSGGFDLNGLWSPWYVEHKLFAGLRDAYRYTGNETALAVEIKFARWVQGILAPLDDAQIQKMLATEFGGMNEVLADLYADTGDAQWLALSGKFEHKAIVDPLAEHLDILGGKHGNTNVPKLYGDLIRYVYSGDETDHKAADYFFDQVSLHHTYATGGHGKNEYFGPPDKLAEYVDGRTDETCDVYNMIKFARESFAIEPDVRYADFHERAIFNHILASQDPDDGRVCYMVPVGRGVQHEYQDPLNDFTCCVGSAMESHALHSFGIYYERGNKLWVNLFAPTSVNWKSQNVQLEMQTDFPIGDSATLKVNPAKSKELTLAIRRPFWAGDGFSVKVNGKPLKDVPAPDSYVEITRTWKKGDTISLVLPKKLRVEPLADDANLMAVMWGPLALAGDLGPERDWQAERAARRAGGAATAEPAVPVFVAKDPAAIDSWMKPVAGKPGAFRTSGVSLATDIDFVPFYELPRRRYAIYWDVFTPDEWAKKQAAFEAEQEKQKKLEAATIAFAQPGQMQSERDINEQGEDTTPIQVNGRYGRRGSKWFSFDIPVDPAAKIVMVVTYNTAGRARSFNILVDGTKVGEQSMDRTSPEDTPKFFDVEYPLPPDLVAGKQKVTVRFEATNGNDISAVFGIRMVRAAAR
jgi:DUF1680 family protein